eukprot:5759392-Amphidinium_carterae.1
MDAIWKVWESVDLAFFIIIGVWFGLIDISEDLHGSVPNYCRGCSQMLGIPQKSGPCKFQHKE